MENFVHTGDSFTQGTARCAENTRPAHNPSFSVMRSNASTVSEAQETNMKEDMKGHSSSSY